MRPSENIEKLINKLEVEPRTDASQKNINDAIAAHQKAKSSVHQKPNIWRIIMKNSITKIAAAVMVIIACMAALTMFDRTSNIALADVLSRIENSNAYMYQMSLTSAGQVVGNMNVDAEIKGTVFMSKEYGTKMILETRNLKNEEIISQQMYLVPEEKYATIIMPIQKYYMQMELNDTLIEQFQNESYDPGDILEQILRCEYKNLGKSVIDGIEVQGFQTTDPQYCGSLFDKVDIKLWIDVKTLLPIQMEMNCQMENQTALSINGMFYDYQWDIPVDASDFVPNIPSDYSDLTPPVMQK